MWRLSVLGFRKNEMGTAAASASSAAFAAAAGSPSKWAARKAELELEEDDEDTYLDCPFEDKDEAKDLGAMWDQDKRKWFVPAGEPLEPFRKWLPKKVAFHKAPKWKDYPDNRDPLTTLRIVTWNIAELERSRVAAASWSATDQLRAVQKVVKEQKPDVFALQECPRADFDLLPSRYVRCASAPSHCGFTSIYVHRRFAKKLDFESDEQCPIVVDQILPGFGLPAACCVLDICEESFQLALVAVHLAPFGQNAELRTRQLHSIATTLKRNTYAEAVVVFGDTNMRSSEAAAARPFGGFRFPLRHVPCEYKL